MSPVGETLERPFEVLYALYDQIVNLATRHKEDTAATHSQCRSPYLIRCHMIAVFFRHDTRFASETRK